jgi:hypothetical protein
LLGITRLTIGDRAGAGACWQRARDMAESLSRGLERASVLAILADAHARAGDLAPAETFCQQFQKLVAVSPADILRDVFLSRWIEECVAAGQPEEALHLSNAIGNPACRFESQAIVALSLVRTGAIARYKSLLADLSLSAKSGPIYPREAASTSAQ